jgi:prephenate dehydratase
VVEYDTAGAAEIVAGLNNIEDAAIASLLAGEIHGLQILHSTVEDFTHNTTRFPAGQNKAYADIEKLSCKPWD